MNRTKLSLSEKTSHNLNACFSCSSHHQEILDYIPKVGTKKQNKEKTHPIELPTIQTPDRAFQKTPQYQIQVASTVLQELSETWESTFKTPLTEVIRKVPSVQLTPRKTKVEKQKEKRNIHRKCKKEIEAIWTKENRDVETFYGTRQSGSGLTKQRSSLNFETRQNALKRTGELISIFQDIKFLSLRFIYWGKTKSFIEVTFIHVEFLKRFTNIVKFG